MDAIVYTSNTGTTKQYAELLAQRTGLKVYSLDDCKLLANGSEIIYLGWLMAGTVMGLKKANKNYKVKVICAVGMSDSEGQLDEIRKSVKDAQTPMFMLQGGFDITKLHGIYRFMMSVMKKTAGKALSEKKTRTPDEDDMLDLLMNGGNRVKSENLDKVIAYIEASNL